MDISKKKINYNKTYQNIPTQIKKYNFYNKQNKFGLKKLWSKHQEQSLSCLVRGSGGGTSGRAMVLCLGRPGLYPGTDLGFFQFRIAVNLFSLAIGLFLIPFKRRVHTITSSFLFPIINYHFTIYQL